MKKIGYILATVALAISGYFTVLKINRYSEQSIEKDKFIANIKAGRKSYDEENWMSPLSVRENDRARLLKDTVIEVRTGKVYPLATLLDTPNLFLYYKYKNLHYELDLSEMEDFYENYHKQIRFLLLSNDNLINARLYEQNHSLKIPFYIFKSGNLPPDINSFPTSHLTINDKTAYFYEGNSFFDNKDFYQYVDSVLVR